MQVNYKILDIMLKLVRFGMGIDKETDFSGVDIAPLMPQVYALAKHHDVAHIVAYAVKQLKIVCDEETAKKLDKQYLIAIFRYQHQRYDLSTIINTFEESGIAHIPLKGSVLRRYYPQEWMRTGCDIDILVKVEEVERARDILISKHGYKSGYDTTHDISLDSPGGTHIELHFDLMEDDHYGEDIVLKDFFSDATVKAGRKYHFESTPEMFVYYHISHMAKHFVNGGCGIRPFLDLYVINSMIDYDKDRLNDLLERGGHLRFFKIVQSLSCAWFSNGSLDALGREVADFVLTGGTYGNVENMVAIKATKKGSRLGYIIHRIFIPYNELIYSYPSLKGKKVLTPVYWVRRFFRIVFSKRLKYSFKEIKEGVSVDKDKSDRVAKFFSDIGLQIK